MLNIHLSCQAVFIVLVLLSLGIAAVKAYDITPRAERSGGLRGEGTRQYWEYDRSAHTDFGGQDTTEVNDDDYDNDDHEEDINDGAHEQFDENEDGELENDGLGPSFKDYYSSIQHSHGMNADDDTKADEIRRENEDVSKKQSLLMKDEELGDDEQYDGNEEDELEHDGLDPSARNSMHHSRTWKKDEILERNVNTQHKQPTNAGDDDEDADDGSGDETDGSISGGGSGSDSVQQSSPARKPYLDAEDSKNHNNGSNDEKNDAGNAAYFSSRLILEPNNKTSLRKTAPEESNKAEQLEMNKEDSDNDDDISGDESGSTSDFVQGSGELTEDIMGKHFFSKPRPPNRANLSTERKQQRKVAYQDSKIQLKNLKEKYTEETGKPQQNVHTYSSVNGTKSTMKDHEIESNHHKIYIGSPTENKAEKKELHGDKVDRTSRVSKVKQNITNNTVSKLETPVRNRPVEASKVSLPSPQKGLHSQHMAHVTQAVKSHPKPSHTKPIGKVTVPSTASSAKPQSCQSEKILSGHSLKGGTRAGQFEILGEASSMRACLQRCCSKQDCDVALLINGRCYGVGCYSKELCLAVPVPHPHFVVSQLAYIDKGHKRGDIELHREFLCKYGNLTLRNNEYWSGELCGGVVQCKNGVATVKKCSGIPPKPDHCAKPQLIVKHQPGKCCKMKWKCKASHCVFNNRLIKHGSKLSDPLCTGIVRCSNGHLGMEYCPQIPEKPRHCARPILKTINVPGKCCKKHWVCSDKTCRYDSIKLQHREKLTDASCAVVMECRNGFLHSKRCPGPPPVPHACINPSLRVKRVPGECCVMDWTCAIS